MWHRYSLLLCAEFILCAPKAEVDKDQGNVYLETQKQSTPPFFHVKHPLCFFSFLHTAWVGFVISVDVSAVALVSC
jgi:hypothetical protein